MTFVIKYAIIEIENKSTTIGADTMYNTNITNARSNLYGLVKMAIEDNEVVNISTKDGNAVIISEADYNSLLETLYLSSNPILKKSLIDGLTAPDSDFVDEKDAEWE